MRNRFAFTLVELLVVIGLIALLIGIIVPSFKGVRRSALAAKDLGQLRSLQLAHWQYMNANNGYFVDVGIQHGAIDDDDDVAWLNTLQEYYDNPLVVKSPLDESPHWAIEDGGRGIPVPGSNGRFRRTSYGVNEMLTKYNPLAALDPERDFTLRLTQVMSPATTTHFLTIAFEGIYARSDHIHIHDWVTTPNPEAAAAQYIQTNSVRGKPATMASESNYGFLDGHVETQKFSDVWVKLDVNKFDPEASRQIAIHSRQ